MASYEQRSTFRLLSYWNSIKDEADLPDIADISIGAMEDLWGMCFVLQAKDRSQLEFQHFGSELIEIFEHDYTGKKLEEVTHPVLADIEQFLEEVWLMQSPVSHCGEVSDVESKLRYRSLLAPLSEFRDGNIHYLIGTTNYRRYG